MNVQKLFELQAQNPAAQIYFATFAGRRRSFAQTTVQDVVDLARRQRHPLSPVDVVAFLEGLEDADCGQFVRDEEGERFLWLHKASIVARYALQKHEALAASEPEAAASFLVTHTLRLRADVSLSLQLPPDFSPEEAERVCHFVLALPILSNEATMGRNEALME